MMSKKIEPGTKIHSLTFIRDVDSINGPRMCECLCDCGNTRVMSKAGFGKSKTCGVLHKFPKVGNKFKMLSFVKIAGKNDKGRQLWEMLCECGNSKIICRKEVVAGAESCGCVFRNELKPGQQFGYLEVLSNIDSNLSMF